jgi:hypothetical protein
MWFNIKKDDKEERIEMVDVEKCNECGCLINKKNSQTVDTNIGTQFFCQSHRKKYSKMYCTWQHPELFRYFAELQVDENGEPIGYKKVSGEKVSKSIKTSKA